jgi:hypothetical protein
VKAALVKPALPAPPRTADPLDVVLAWLARKAADPRVREWAGVLLTRGESAEGSLAASAARAAAERKGGAA